MRNTEKKSRREFLTSSGSVLGASMLALNMPLILTACERAQTQLQSGAAYENITLEQAVELGAIADQIIPEDETPGATQTGVVYFMDTAFGGFMAGALPMLTQGSDSFSQWRGNPQAAVFVGVRPVPDGLANSSGIVGKYLMGNAHSITQAAFEQPLVDKFHRAHDVPNLFICDGSSFVSSGRGQPTMTIQAPAFRAAEHIANFARRGEI